MSSASRNGMLLRIRKKPICIGKHKNHTKILEKENNALKEKVCVDLCTLEKKDRGNKR